MRPDKAEYKDLIKTHVHEFLLDKDLFIGVINIFNKTKQNNDEINYLIKNYLKQS